MRNSSEAVIDDRGLRDVDRWKDKIEVRLDNRQVFFLFFGSALVACLLFVLGVIVGKRLESRGKAVAPEIEDPLALLDKVASTPLAPGAGTASVAAGKRSLLGTLAAATATTPPTSATRPAPAAPAPIKPAAAPAPAAAAPPAKQPLTTEKAIAALAPKPAAPPPPEAPPAAAEAAPAPAPAAAPPAAAAPVKPAPAAAKTGGETGGKARRFTLQLGSFPDRAEAEAFATRFGAGSGASPYVIAAEVPGKGTWYRVRVGDYANSKDAVAAKTSFEKQHNVIAYVVPPAPPAPPPPR
jgi:DedD protein